MAIDDIQIPAAEMKRFGKFLRRNRIGTTVQQSRRSIERYEALHGNITVEQLRENFSAILIECYQIETEIFVGIRDEIGRMWVNDLLEFEDRQREFPTISNLVDQALASLNRDEPVEQKLSVVISILQRVNDGVSQSMRQSGRPRAGGAFENYLDAFFTMLDFKFELQKELQQGQVLDFILPSLELLLERQDDVIWIECQTSLRDRFRLSMGKTNELNERSTKFLATLAGLNLMNQDDDQYLDDELIQQIHDHTPERPWRVIALRQIAEDRNSPTVISFEDFVNIIYPEISDTWE